MLAPSFNSNVAFNVQPSDVVETFSEGTRAVLGSGVPRNFFQGGVQQIQWRTEDREDGDLGAVAP